MGNHVQLQQMLSMIGGQIPVPRNGPAMVLASRMARVGWAIHPTGLIHDDISPFCRLSVHWDELSFRLGVAWPKAMATLVSHRKSFARVERAHSCLETIWRSRSNLLEKWA